MKEKHLYSFGEFNLNVEDHTLSRNGENVPVTPKMFDLLLVLVQHPGRVLRKDFLLQAVWPDSFVEEGNITFNIRQLRKALGDDAQSPTYIETIQRRGYRFIPPVEAFTTITPDKDEETIAKEEQERRVQIIQPESQKSRPYVFLLMSSAVVIFGVIVIGGWFLKIQGSGGVPILSKPFASEKLSTDGSVFHAAISPDGKNVVYTHRSGGKQSLWLRQLESSNNVPIIPPSKDFYGGLAISPDGQSIYFTRGRPQLAVYRMPIFGGVPQKLVDGTQGWISVSAKGDKISFVRCPATESEHCALYIADALDGLNERKLISRPRPIRIGDNEISPDGKSIAFASGQSRTSSNEFMLWTVDIETGIEREATPQKFFNINYIAWLPDNSGFLITALKNPERSYRIWKVSTTGEAEGLTSDSETYSRLSLDSAGNQLVSTQILPEFRLMLYQTDNPKAPPRILGNASSVTFGPDGVLYFSSVRTGDAEIWRINQDGTDQRQLTSEPSPDVVPVVSPDNKYIFFESSRSGKIQVWRMNTDGTNQTQVTTEEGGFPLRVTSDGSWLYYRSPLNNTIRRVATRTGQEELVMKEQGDNAAVSPDASRVAFAEYDQDQITIGVYSLADQSLIKRYKVPSAPTVAQLAWSGDGKLLAYMLADSNGEGGILWFQPVDSESPHQVADLSGDDIAELAALSISMDGKSFVTIKGTWKHDAVLLRGLK